MEILHKELLKGLAEVLDETPDLLEEIDIENIINELTPEMVELISDSLKKSVKGVLKERRKQSKKFIQRNVKRWANAFDSLETHIFICTEAGEEFNASYRTEAVNNSDLVFDIIVSLHARACHISHEILCLLTSGYADGAHARWRALHEVNVTAKFIAKHGSECAERFYYHDIVDSYDGMVEHKKYEDRLNEKAPEQEEIDECKKEYDALHTKYGKTYLEHYGWASYIFSNRSRVGFTAIEKDVGLDHMRPYYKWASQNIHSGSKGMRNRLGLCEAKEDILLVGQSNSGMTDPAHATALSLCQITHTLLMLKTTFDHVVLMHIIDNYEESVGQTFLDIDS